MKSVVLRYGLSALSVAISLSLTLLLGDYTFRTPLFFPAILLSTWFLGTGPGLLAVLLSTLSINFFILEPKFAFSFGVHDIPHLTVFVFSALLISSWSAARRRAEDALRRARNELEAKVKERTAELSQSNEQLQNEIAERESREEELQRQANLLEQTHDAILVWEFSGKITHWNHGAEQLYGFSKKEAIGCLSHELLRTEHPVTAELFEAMIERDGLWTGELTHTTRDGRRIIVESRHVLMRGADGRRLVLETNRDITERKRADEALREQANLLNLTHDTVFVRDVNDVITYWNRGAEEMYGWTSEEAIGQVSHQLMRTIFPAPLQEIKAQLLGTGRWEGELVHTKRDGTQVAVASRWSLERDDAGNFLAVLETNNDISARKRAEVLLAGEKRLLEMVAKGDPLALILDALCRLVEELASGALSSVLLLDPNGKQLRHGAAPNLPKAYTDAIDGVVIGPSVGSCGTAAYLAKPVIVSDIATDALWADYRDIALSQKLRACWSSPILSSEGKVLGTFAIYYREPATPKPEQLEIIEQLTHLASIALERKRGEEALRASEQVARGQVEALAQSLDVLATAPEPEKFIGQMLSTIGRLLNAQSVSLWLIDESTDSLALRLMVDGGRLAAPDPEHPFVKDPLFLKQNAVIQELLFTAGPVVCEDLETDPRIPGEWRDYLKRKGAKRFLGVPILIGGQVRGFIGVRHNDQASYRPEEIELTQALAHQVMLALQLNEFAEQGQRAAVFEERNRMARDIHDTLAQGFTGVIVQLEAAEDAASCGCRKEADKHVHRAGALARRSLSEARRSVHALRPQALQEQNFWDALKGIIKTTTLGTPLQTKVELRGKMRELPPLWQENLLRIGQEALTNTLKHAHAHNFETRLSYKAKELRLELRDDGNGFKVKDRHDGVGLTGMRERVEQMGGELKITSSRGKGTKVSVVLPCNGESMS